MARSAARVLAVVVLAVAVAACSGDDDEPSGGGGTTTAVERVDYAELGLWDDGPCDPAKPKLVVGTSVVFESPIISLGDTALGLEAAGEAFNERGGANGSCVEVRTCDDGANAAQALECVRELDDAGVVATINDQTTAGNAEVAEALSDLGIPRIATNVSPDDWGDPNAYPMDASSTGVAFLLPQGLVTEGAKKIGILRPDLAQTAALKGLLEGMYGDEGATFPYDVAVPAGTTDFSQFILGAEEAGVDGVILLLGEQEAIQVVKAAEQLGTDLLLSASLSTFPHASIAEFGDIAEQMVFSTSFPPVTADVPAYAAVRADLAASGEDALQPGEVKVTPVRSWLGLYALLRMIRDAELTEFSREGITSLLADAEDVPLLGAAGEEAWTPSADHPGLFKRAGTNHWGIYRWDPDAPAPAGLEGNFVERATVSFDEVICGSPFGGPC